MAIELLRCDYYHIVPVHYADGVRADLRAVDEIDARFSAGGEDALRLAYEAHGSMVYSFCRRRLGEDRAKDVTQEVFVSAWRSRDRFDPAQGTLAGWLIGIAKFRLLDNVRSDARHADRRSDREPDALTIDVGLESEIDDMADRMLLGAALETLPERARTAIELAFFADMSHREVADHTGQPLGTVKSDIRRGLDKLRRHLGSLDE